VTLIIRFEDGAIREIKDVWRTSTYLRPENDHLPELVIYVQDESTEYLELTRVLSFSMCE
jgi:hypothetical protein